MERSLENGCVIARVASVVVQKSSGGGGEASNPQIMVDLGGGVWKFIAKFAYVFINFR